MISPERFSRVDELLDSALDQPIERRSAWLREACAGEPSLLAEVEALLNLAERDDGIHEAGTFQGPVWDELVTEIESMGELAAGESLGAYEIRGLIGRGGMGAVYRATDRTLGRDVAIKALTRGFAGDGSSLRRFEREAKLLASLNHPNIAVIYDLLELEGKTYLVLELVEGETLSDRLTRGPVGLREALPIAIQLADALEEAHRKGVVHRDLKPSNVKLTPEGRVKVLDFGVAKSHEPADDKRGGNTPTAAVPTTESGVILGTPGYMSPEQARGLGVDKRSDIWAFGCLLYEMLAGARAFAGKTYSDAIAASLRDEVDWGRLPRSTPAGVERLLRRCLKQDTRERLQDIGDARIELEELARGGRSGSRPALRPAAAIALVALLAFVAGAAFLRILDRRAPLSGESVRRTSILIGPGERLWQGASSSVAISPDGSRTAFVIEKDDRVQLFVRSLSAYDRTPVRSSDGARDPFFSPDGESVGFFAGGEMRRVHLASGSSASVAGAGIQSRGASWGADGRIVFAQEGTRGLFVVPASGGQPEKLLSPDASEDVLEYLWPQWLPNQSAVLFTARRLSPAIADELAVVDLGSGRVVTIGKGKQGVYVPTGHVVYQSGGSLEAVRFDVDRLAVEGGSVRVIENVHGYPRGASSFCVASSGTLLYQEPPLTATLDWVDRLGVRVPVAIPRGTPGWPRLSPAGRFAALHVGGPETRDLWLLDLDRPGSSRQITYEGGGFPVWSPDGERIAFMSRHQGNGDLYAVPADGSGSPERVVASERTKIPVSWSPDGVLAYYEIGDASQRDIWVVELDSDSTPAPKPFVATGANELSPVFSPDGRHLAYVSNETGKNEVYVRPYPHPGPVTAISIDGGRRAGLEPRRKGALLSPQRYPDERVRALLASLRGGAPRPGDRRAASPRPRGQRFVRRRGGRSRFLMLRPPPGSSVEEVRLVLGWSEELRRLAPAP